MDQLKNLAWILDSLSEEVWIMDQVIIFRSAIFFSFKFLLHGGLHSAAPQLQPWTEVLGMLVHFTFPSPPPLQCWVSSG